MRRASQVRVDPEQVEAKLRKALLDDRPKKRRRPRTDSAWRAECVARRGSYCRGCGDTRQPQADHIIPRAQGGPSVVENGMILGGPFGCGCHDRKTAHRLLVQRAWLDDDQVQWLAEHGHVTWTASGEPTGRHAFLFAPQRPPTVAEDRNGAGTDPGILPDRLTEGEADGEEEPR